MISPQPSSDEFLKQLDCYFDKYGVGGHTEIYNSGSFLDDKQVSHDSRVNIFGKLENSGVRSAVIESRPEYITRKKLEPIAGGFTGELTVGIGLEVADNQMLRKLKKGFLLEDVEKSLAILADMDISSRAYILVGAPFIEDSKATALDSVRYAKEIGFSEISLLAAYPMKGSKGYEMWKSGKWVPLKKSFFREIVKLAKEIAPDIDYSSNGLARL